MISETGARPAANLMPALAIGSIGILILGIEPVLLASFVADQRIAPEDVGLLVTIELLAIALGTVIGMRLLQRVPAPLLAFIAGVLAATADALAIGRSGLSWLIPLRGVAGIAEGILISFALVAVARAALPARASGFYLAAQTLLQLIVAAVIPNLTVGGSGADVALATLAASGAAAALIGLALPRWLRPAASDETGGAVTLRSFVGLLAAAGFMGAIVSVWSYLGLWIASLGYPPTMVGTTVAISLGCQVLGALVAAKVSDQLPAKAVIVSTSLLEIALLVLLLSIGYVPFVVYLLSAGFGFLWLFTMPSFTSLLIDIDPSRRAVLYLGAAQLGGSALLPMLAAFAVEQDGVDGALWFAIGAFVATAAIILAIGGKSYTPFADVAPKEASL